MRGREISTEEIDTATRELTRDELWFYASRMRMEQEYHWFVASPGVLVGGFSDFGINLDGVTANEGAVGTEYTLRGSEAKLNGQSIVSYYSYALPKDSQPKNIKHYDNEFIPWIRKPELCRHIGKLSVLEPGVPIFNPIKSETDFYFDLDLDMQGKEVAIHGLELLLNNREAMIQGDEAHEIDDEIKRSLRAHEELRQRSSDNLRKRLLQRRRKS